MPLLTEVAALDESLNRGNSSFGTLGREQRRLITQATHEWEEPSRGHQQWVVSIFSPRQLLTKSTVYELWEARHCSIHLRSCTLGLTIGLLIVDQEDRSNISFDRFLWLVHTTEGIAKIEMPLARPPFTLMITGFYKTRNIKMNLTIAVKTEIFFETSLFFLHGLWLVMWFWCSRNRGGVEGSAYNLLEKLLAPCGCQDRLQGRSNRSCALGGCRYRCNPWLPHWTHSVSFWIN